MYDISPAPEPKLIPSSCMVTRSPLLSCSKVAPESPLRKRVARARVQLSLLSIRMKGRSIGLAAEEGVGRKYLMLSSNAWLWLGAGADVRTVMIGDAAVAGATTFVGATPDALSPTARESLKGLDPFFAEMLFRRVGVSLVLRSDEAGFTLRYFCFATPLT